MRTHLKNRKGLVLVVGLVAIALIAMARLQPAQAERAAAAESTAGPHYTVVETEGHNLIVTDNQNDTLYFYTIEKDKEIGSDLKLRGKVDLKQVGKPVIVPETTKKGD